MESIRDFITEKANKLRDIDALGLNEAEKELVGLSSILSTLNKEIADAHYWYNMKKVELLNEHETVAKTNLVAQASKEWKDWTNRRVQKEAVVEMIRSLKYFVKGAREEKRESVY